MCIVFKEEKIRCNGDSDTEEVVMIYWLGELIPSVNRIICSKKCLTNIDNAVDCVHSGLC
jgi:hypothetical protein